MVKGVGIDSVEIERFAEWHNKSHDQLQKVFSDQEIDYCLSNITLSAERFAVRFAAREAFYKALCMMQPQYKSPFSATCKLISFSHQDNGALVANPSWQELGVFDTLPRVMCSVTHTKTTATAIVILEE